VIGTVVGGYTSLDGTTSQRYWQMYCGVCGKYGLAVERSTWRCEPKTAEEILRHALHAQLPDSL
jgi:hypothetical protein